MQDELIVEVGKIGVNPLQMMACQLLLRISWTGGQALEGGSITVKYLGEVESLEDPSGKKQNVNKARHKSKKTEMRSGHLIIVYWRFWNDKKQQVYTKVAAQSITSGLLFTVSFHLEICESSFIAPIPCLLLMKEKTVPHVQVKHTDNDTRKAIIIVRTLTEECESESI